MSGDLILGIAIGALGILLLLVIVTTVVTLMLRTAIHHTTITDLDTPDDDGRTRRLIEDHGGHA